MTRGRVLAVVAIVAFVLGYIGYRHVAGHHYSVSDAVFWSISLFYGRLGTIPHATPVALDVGRFLALAVFASVAVTGAILVLRVRWDRWVVGRFASGHTLVVGDTPQAGSAGEALSGAGQPVVLLDADARSPTAMALRLAGARVIPGDATRSATLDGIRLDRARRVLLLSGSDERNLQILGAMLSVLGAHPRGMPAIHVAIHDLPAWEELSREENVPSGPIRLEFVNLDDRAAIALADAATQGDNVTPPSTVLIEGTGRLAVRLSDHLVDHPARTGTPMTLLVPDNDNGDALLKDLQNYEPDLVARANVRQQTDTDHADVAIVCHSDLHAGVVSRALALAREGAADRVVLAAEHRVALAALQMSGIAPESLQVVPVGVEALVLELVARAG